MNAPIANLDAQRRLSEAHCWASAIRFAAGEVDKLAAHFVGNTKIDGTRDAVLYEQGIGCERAGQMLREVATLIEQRGEKPNDQADPSEASK
jgi:hypothetical protein